MKILIWVLATIAVIGAGAPASAAAQNLPNQFVCPREIGESNADWKFRCDQEEFNEAQRRGENLARQSQDVAQQRAALEKQPTLPATRNRILGRWAMPAARRGSTNDPFAGLSNMLTNGTCTVLFGNGAVEFRADRWVLHDADGATDLGPASYREGKDGIIYILPQKSLVQLLGLKLDTPGRLLVMGGSTPCSMLRVNEATSAPPAAPAPPPPAPRATAAAPTGAAILSLATGLPTLAGLANPLAGRLWILMRESFDSVLTRSGLVPPAGQTPMQGWIAACRQGAAMCQQILDAAAPSAATMAQMDAAGKTTFPGVPPGTYYVFGSAVYGSDPLFWNLRVDLKNGVNPVTLDQRNTVR